MTHTGVAMFLRYASLHYWENDRPSSHNGKKEKRVSATNQLDRH